MHQLLVPNELLRELADEPLLRVDAKREAPNLRAQSVGARSVGTLSIGARSVGIRPIAGAKARSAPSDGAVVGFYLENARPRAGEHDGVAESEFRGYLLRLIIVRGEPAT